MVVQVDGFVIKEKVVTLLKDKYGFDIEKAEELAHAIETIVEESDGE